MDSKFLSLFLCCYTDSTLRISEKSKYASVQTRSLFVNVIERASPNDVQLLPLLSVNLNSQVTVVSQCPQNYTRGAAESILKCGEYTNEPVEATYF